MKVKVNVGRLCRQVGLTQRGGEGPEDFLGACPLGGSRRARGIHRDGKEGMESLRAEKQARLLHRPQGCWADPHTLPDQTLADEAGQKQDMQTKLLAPASRRLPEGQRCLPRGRGDGASLGEEGPEGRGGSASPKRLLGNPPPAPTRPAPFHGAPLGQLVERRGLREQPLGTTFANTMSLPSPE